MSACLAGSDEFGQDADTFEGFFAVLAGGDFDVVALFDGENRIDLALVLALDGFNDALRGAYEKRMPHILCEHAYALAQAFSGFYAAAPILVESDPVKKASRLALALATLKQLELLLGLIGVETPERM